MWWISSLLGVLAIATHAIAPHLVVDEAARFLPILFFLVSVTILAEVADAAQVFQTLAGWAARRARGSIRSLFLVTALLASVITIVLSLDTTAILFTPVALAIAARLGLPPMPFAMAALWLSNTASLLLPVSNLTNLLAASSVGLTPTQYAGAMAPAAVTAIAITIGALLLIFRRSLCGRYSVPAQATPQDPLFLWLATACCMIFVAALSAGLSAPLAAGSAAVLAIAAAAWRNRSIIRWSMIPWRLVLMTSGLFLVIGALGPHGLDEMLRRSIGSPLRTAAVSAGAANLLNNLPAYLALERVVPRQHLLALLLGVNLGPLVLPWGSLATLLWAERCRVAGVQIRWRLVIGYGLVLAPILLLATVPLL